MTRRHLLALALTLPLAGCGSGLKLSLGNNGSGTGEKISTTGRVVLPSGSPLALGSLRLLSGLNPAQLNTDGSFTLAQFSGDSALLVLTDSESRLLLLGFSGSTGTELIGEVSPLQTSVALMFLALGAFTLPTDQHETIRRLLNADSRVQALAAQLETALATNPYALAESDPILIGAVTALRDALFPSVSRAIAPPKTTRSRDESLDATLIQTSPENELHGFRAGANAEGLGLTVTNTRRRNAILSIYESAYFIEGSNDPMKVPTPAYHRVVNQQILWGTSGLVGVVGSLLDYANGTVAYGPITSGPYNLDLFPSTAVKTEYRVELVANGNTGDSSGLFNEHVTLPSENTPTGQHLQICFITFVKDLLLPAIATLSGLQESLKLDLLAGQGMPSSELLKNVDDLALIFSGVVDSGIAISASSARSLLVGVLKALGNNGTLRQKFIEWLVVVFARQGFTAGVGGAVLGTLATALNAIVIVVDKVLGAADIGAVLADWARSDSYLLFTSKVIASKFKLSPNTASINAGESVSLRASTLIDAPVLTYQWRIVSGNGTLINPVSGASGTSLDSASPELRFQSKESLSKETVTVVVEGFVGSVNDPNRKSLGKATSTLTVNPRTVTITPASSTLSPGDSLSLSAALSGTFAESLRYQWTLSGDTSGVSLTNSGGQNTAQLATTATAKGIVTVHVEVAGTPPGGEQLTLAQGAATVTINDDIPFGSVRVVFDGKTRLLPRLNVQRLSSPGLALGATYQKVSTEYGGLVGLKLIVQFSTPTVVVGSTAQVVSDYDLTLELPSSSGSLYFAPSAPGTLTVTEVGSGYFGYTLSVNLKGLRGVPTTGPAVFRGWVTNY